MFTFFQIIVYTYMFMHPIFIAWICIHTCLFLFWSQNQKLSYIQKMIKFLVYIDRKRRRRKVGLNQNTLAKSLVSHYTPFWQSNHNLEEWIFEFCIIWKVLIRAMTNITCIVYQCRLFFNDRSTYLQKK